MDNCSFDEFIYRMTKDITNQSIIMIMNGQWLIIIVVQPHPAPSRPPSQAAPAPAPCMMSGQG